MSAERDLIFGFLKNLQPESAGNLREFLECETLPEWAVGAVAELAAKNGREELNDRFYKKLSFGTGGLRGRVLAANPVSAEIDGGEPLRAAVGTSCLNDFTVVKAALGLWKFCSEYCAKTGAANRLVIARDVRFFSKRFCDLTASVWGRLGGEAYVFGGARSTPQLSYTVRKLKALAGVVITASHNPAHDNGYKVYFSDGGQITSRLAKEISDCISSTTWEEACKFLDIDLSCVKAVPPEAESSYIESISDCVLDKALIAENPPKIVYSPLHGTGAVACPKAMRYLGIEPVLVEEQMVMDSRFPTVKTPNPEYPEALALGLEKCLQCGADALLVTDPDADRLGVAVREKGGSYKILNGNTISAALFYYRAKKMREIGLIENPKKCAVLKTFVTTSLVEKIARASGIKCVNLLTGFKWIGERLTHYEDLLAQKIGAAAAEKLPYAERAKALQKYSTFAVFGCEESFGYIATDSVRDKDANAALAMFCELMAHLKKCGSTFGEYMADIYAEFGWHCEKQASAVYEGAIGAQKIRNFLKSLEEKPLGSLCGSRVANSLDFSKGNNLDADAMPLPPEKFYFYTLENGVEFAIRASGTEPKIKFYIFACARAPEGRPLKEAEARAEKLAEEAKTALIALAGERCA